MLMCRRIVRLLGVRSAAYAPSQLEFRRPVASQAYPIGTTPGLTTGVGLPEPATRPIEAKYRAILGPYLPHSRDIAGIFDPGTCAPIYLDWQSGEPSPRPSGLDPRFADCVDFYQLRCLLSNPL